ncbi:MAG: hypothetical protein JJU05_07605 [Verrucomicrobia bacterium]|nr:hypothetical protein [Verrucomicrobiota bacterium]MCH8527792.1 hypothetical protein [Kiritimatiellia bacterium]
MKRSIRLAEAPPRLGARIAERTAYAGGLYRIRFTPEAPFAFRPGDCVGVYGPKGNVSRPYSLSGGTDDTELELLIRRIPGGRISDWLYTLPIGTRLEISPPFGWFHPGEAAHPHQVWFATGSGVAPFLSALRSGGQHPLQARWGVRSVLDLEGIDGPFERFVSRGEPGGHRAGRVTDDLDTVRVGPEVHYYLCGLDAMIEEVASMLAERGVGEDRIHRECFFQAQAS